MKTRTSAIIAVLCLGLAAAAYVITDKSCRFNKEIWAASRQMNDHDEVVNKAAPRRCMASDLERKHLRKGMKKEEVVELLGKPDATKENEYSYDLGMVWIDYCFLDIYFSEAGKLENTRSYCNGNG
ncbi:MAG: hypothetical protein DI582_10035 [Azospirillum brasilense]|nr:MAG: hypothetical protein DI582_10035 [Azospirillum brasilense]